MFSLLLKDLISDFISHSSSNQSTSTYLLSAYLPIYPATDLPIYLPKYLPTQHPTYQHTNPPSYLPSHLPTCLHTYLSIHTYSTIQYSTIWQEFKAAVDTLIGKYVPSKILRGKKNLHCVTQEIKRMTNKRDHLYLLPIKCRTLSHLEHCRTVESFKCPFEAQYLQVKSG